MNHPPPHDLEAEQAALGAALLSADALATILKLLRADDFYRPAHRTIYTAVRALVDRGDPVDAVTVFDELDRDGGLADVGGGPFLHTLIEGVPTVANAGHYARQVAEKAALRRLIDTGYRITQLGHQNGQGAAGAVEQARAILAETFSAGRVAGQPLPSQPAGAVPERPRPLPLVDGLLQEGELLVLGAGRGIGKTWWGMDLAHQLARGHGRVMGTYTVRQAARVLYCHGELDPWAAHDRWQRLRGDDDLPVGLLETFEPWRVKVLRRRVTHQGDGLATSEETLEAHLDERLEATITAERIEVIVIDPWAVFYNGRENSNDEAELALATLRRLQLDRRLTVVILHHFGKAETARDPEDLWRGASRLADWASTRVTLLPFYTPAQIKAQGLSRQQARQYADVKLLRRNAASPYDIAAKWNPETGQWDRWRAPEGEGDLSTGPTPADVAAKCPTPAGWSSTVVAAAALGVSRDKARVLLEQAKQQGLLEEFDGPRQARGWRVNGAAR